MFEGINVMSQNQTMSEEELEEMHGRAEKAGMYPYGAGPEQMQGFERRPEDAPSAGKFLAEDVARHRLRRSVEVADGEH